MWVLLIGEMEESGERKMQGGQEKSAVNSDAFSKLFETSYPRAWKFYFSVWSLGWVDVAGEKAGAPSPFFFTALLALYLWFWGFMTVYITE